MNRIDGPSKSVLRSRQTILSQRQLDQLKLALIETMAFSVYVCGALALSRQVLSDFRLKVILPDEESLRGKVCILTGASSGIGYETALRLGQLGCRVVIGVRKDHIEDLRQLLISSVPHAMFHFIPLDLSCQDSINFFVSQFKSLSWPLHFLVNNAGVMIAPFQITKDGFELHLMVNYIGPFLLIYYLLPILRETALSEGQATRIVNVTSVVHACADSLSSIWDQKEETYSAHRAYANSKLCVLMLSLELATRFQASNIPVLVTAVHPGVVDTPLYRHIHPCLRPLQSILAHAFFRSPKTAALTLLHAMTCPSGDMNGRYLCDFKVSRLLALHFNPA